jgi:hypothetical protein
MQNENEGKKQKEMQVRGPLLILLSEMKESFF